MSSEKMMKAMSTVNNKIGLVEIPKPQPSADEVLVKIVTASVNAAENKIMNGEFVSRFLHAKTNPLIMGWDYSGIVESVGKGVTDLNAGAEVFGHLEYTNKQKQGSYCEYITIKRSMVAEKPPGISHRTAAASATSALTSLQSIRDLGKIEPGEKLLVIGAAGGVGTLAIGIGKKLGAHVTGLCSTKDVNKVESFGVDLIIDRNKQNAHEARNEYKVVFDTPAVYSYAQFSKSMVKDGSFITTLPNLGFIAGMIKSRFSSKKCHFVEVVPKRADLELLAGWLSDGLQVPVDSTFNISDLGQAFKRQTQRDRSGQVVVDLKDWK
ncbi:MAG: NAD(P)-dependent alcohol dehydrogenase [Proteobacteria bacterium]|nr:NAD(P)-dependent alcohol dehydrogenase [Pseudomonadota bacterium]